MADAAGRLDPAVLHRALPKQLDGSSGSLLYSLGLLLVAAAMVLLPVIYLGMVGLAGYGIYWHATDHVSWLAGGGTQARLLVYAVPIAAGAVLVAFLLKPIFSKPVVSECYRPLRREEAPLLFVMVRCIAAAVGAPAPSRIDIDLQVNASAAQIRADEGRELVLTLGLPLAAGLDLRQLAGVLAHEFGHFGQGAGMRLSGWVRSMNFWFARLVYERDGFDQALVDARSRDDALALFAAVGSLGVWLSRGVLWVLMKMGHAVSCIFMRQMEFDADRYEIALAGSDTFAATAHDLTRLGYATRLAFGELEEAWREGRLADDLPQLIAAKAAGLTDEVREDLSEQTLAVRTGFFDTHPSDRERIARAEKAGRPGCIALEAPASLLFSDFAALSHVMTLDYYEDVIGPQVHDTPLVSAGTLLERRERIASESESVGRYFPALVPAYRVFRPGPIEIAAPSEPKQTLARLRELYAASAERSETIVASYRRYCEQEDRRLDAVAAGALLEAGIGVSAQTFQLPTGDASGVARAEERAARLMAATAAELDDFEAPQRERLHCALTLLAHPKVRARLGEAAAALEDVTPLLRALDGLVRHEGCLRQLEEQRYRLATLLANFEGREESEPFLGALAAETDRTVALMESLLGQLGEVPFPFEHAKEQLSVAEHLLPDAPPPPDHAGAVDAETCALLDRLYGLHNRVLGALAAAVEPLEALFGLDERE